MSYNCIDSIVQYAPVVVYVINICMYGTVHVSHEITQIIICPTIIIDTKPWFY